MSRIICPCVECEHRARGSNVCQAGRVVLAERFMHTVHEGYQHFWVCKSYKENGYYNNFIKDLRAALGDSEEETN